MSITRNLAGPVTIVLLLAGTACGSPHAASPAPPAVRVAPATASAATRAPATVDNGVAPATGTAADATAVDATAADLTGVDRSLDELDRDLGDLGQALTQTQEGDVDQ